VEADCAAAPACLVHNGQTRRTVFVELPARLFDRLVRAAHGEIPAWCFHRGFRLIVLEGEPVAEPSGALPGRVVSLADGTLTVAAGRGAYRIRHFLFLDRVHDGATLGAAIGIGLGAALTANPAFDVP